MKRIDIKKILSNPEQRQELLRKASKTIIERERPMVVKIKDGMNAKEQFEALMVLLDINLTQKKFPTCQKNFKTNRANSLERFTKECIYYLSDKKSRVIWNPENKLILTSTSDDDVKKSWGEITNIRVELEDLINDYLAN